MTWPWAHAEMERLHLGKFLHKDNRILQYIDWKLDFFILSSMYYFPYQSAVVAFIPL